MAKKKKITMTVEKTNTGFSVYPEKDLIFATGKSIPELINNAFETADEEEDIKPDTGCFIRFLRQQPNFIAGYKHPLGYPV